MEECFEHLKNSATSYADPMSPQDQYYTPYPGNHSNGSSHTVQRHTSYPAHSTPPHSHYQAQHSDDYIDTQWGREGIPHRAPPSPLVSHRTPGGNTPGFFDDGSTTTPLRGTYCVVAVFICFPHSRMWAHTHTHTHSQMSPQTLYAFLLYAHIITDLITAQEQAIEDIHKVCVSIPTYSMCFSTQLSH